MTIERWDGDVTDKPIPITDDLLAKLEQLRAPFELDEIELLPRYIGRKDNNGKPVDDNGQERRKQQCAECGGYHFFPCVHLSYVGHAGVTMRLLDVDPLWTWEPVAKNDDGTPKLTAVDGKPGLWIRLTVLGVTRLGFGDIGEKSKLTPAAMKELIGDAIRNAAMRFGVGTYLWSKSEAAKATLVRAGEDPDADEPAEPAAEPERIRRSSKQQQQAIHVKATGLGYGDAALKKWLKANYGVESTAQLTHEQAGEVLAKFKAAERDAALAKKEAAAKAAAQDAAAEAPQEGGPE